MYEASKNRARGPIALAAVAVTAGAAGMFLFDPDRGRRRRRWLAQKGNHWWHRADQLVSCALRDASNRAAGMVAEVQGRLRERDVPDALLVDRVRSRLGRIVSHPSSVHVTAQSGHVTLRGPVLSAEVLPLIKAVQLIRGVRHVESQLEPHHDPSHVPGLQGGAWPQRWEFRHRSPTPTMRLVSLAVGGSAVVWAGQRPWPMRWPFGAIGLGLLGFGMSRRERLRFSPIVAPHPGLEIRKTLIVHAPPERVFDFWRNLEAFPRFLSHVREVRDLGRGRSHWSLGGAAGLPVEFNARLTADARPHRLCWRTLPNSDVQHSGAVAFEPWQGGTRVRLRMQYRHSSGDAAGRLGAVLGHDPEREIHEDLMRMKHFMETGVGPLDTAERPVVGG